MKKIKRAFILVVCSLLFVTQIYNLEAAVKEKNMVSSTNLSTEYDFTKGYDIKTEIISEWGNQYRGRITIENISNKTISNWKISFVTKDKIQEVRGARIQEHAGDTYVIRNIGYNRDIRVGRSIVFEFIAQYEERRDGVHDFNMEKTYFRVEESYRVTYKIVRERGNELVGQIDITNTSDRVIEDWFLTYDCDLEIYRVINANIEHKEGKKYFINNIGYNSKIYPRKTITLKFMAIKSMNTKSELSGFELYYIDVYKVDTKDTDQDGLYDKVERYIGSEIDRSDSDNDGLDDYYEVMILRTDPTKLDSDNNGISDSLEDNDGDGLTNLEEYYLGTDPWIQDMDGDGLLDGEEVKQYKTDPFKFDTDDDGVDDYTEIQLELNPLLADTDGNGVIDSKEMIPQTTCIELEDCTVLTGVSISMKTNILLKDELEVDISEEMKIGTLDKSIVLEGEIINANIPANLSFYYDQQLLECEPRELSIYEFDGSEWSKLETIVDTNKGCISADTIALQSMYCVVQENQRHMLRSFSFLRNIPLYTKRRLIQDIESDFNEEEKKKSLLVRKSRKYTVGEVVDLVYQYDSIIQKISEKYEIKKEMLQGILLRELICVNHWDDIADIAVMNYYHNKENMEKYLAYPIWKQIMMGEVRLLYPEKEDSSTGIGQIFATTAMKAMNYCLQQSDAYDYSNWKQRKTVWYHLKDNSEYNIEAVGKVLNMNARGRQIKSPTKDIFIRVTGLYNRSTEKKGRAYGKKIYKYSTYFKKYNKALKERM